MTLLRFLATTAALIATTLGAAPGQILWTHLAPGNLYSSPTVTAGGSILIGVSGTQNDSASNGVIAVNSTGTTRLWTRNLPNWVDSTPALSPDGSTLYVGSWNNNVYAINVSTGAIVWTRATSSYVNSSPAVATDGTIYVGSGDGSLYAINPDGTLKWSYLAGAEIESSPAIAPNGTVVFGTLGGNVIALNPDGSLKWTFTVTAFLLRNSRIKASPTIGNDGTVYIGAGNYQFYAIGPDGVLKWFAEATEEIDSSATIGPEGHVYFASRSGFFYAFDADGGLLWSVLLGDIFYSSAVVDTAGNVYIPAFTGNKTSKVFAFTADGLALWSTTIPAVIDSSPAITPGGVLLVGAYDKKLYALEANAPGATSGWPKFRRDLASTGRLPAGVAPTLSAAPATQLVATGQAATLNVAANGTLPLNIVWRRNGVAIPGATTATYTLPAVGAAQVGLYDAVVFNDFGTVTTTAVPIVASGAASVNGNQFTLTYYRPSAFTGTLAETSTDLITWSTGGVTNTVTATADGVQTVDATTLTTGLPRVFLRLKITP